MYRITKKGRPKSANILSCYIKFHADGFGRHVIFAVTLQMGEIRRNPATIATAKFFTDVGAGTNGFERVAVLSIGSVRKTAFRYSRFHILWIFFSNL